jgi:hypothetical protein
MSEIRSNLIRPECGNKPIALRMWHSSRKGHAPGLKKTAISRRTCRDSIGSARRSLSTSSGGLEVLSGANIREEHGLREDAHMLCTSFIMRLNRWLINADILRANNVPNI